MTTRSPRLWDWRTFDQTPVIPAGEVLVIMAGGIGDAILGLPVIELLRDRLPGVTVQVLADRTVAALLHGQRGIELIIVQPTEPSMAGVLRTAWRLRRDRFDAVIGIRPSSLQSTALLVRLLRPTRAVKHRKDFEDPRSDWQIWFTDLVAEDPRRHNLSCNMDLLGPLGIDARGLDDSVLAHWMRIDLSDAERQWARASYPPSAHGPRIGFHPGCRVGWEFKRWDTARFVELIERMHADLGAEIVVFGGPDELVLAQHLSQAIKCPHRNLIGVLKLRETAAVIADCDVFVSNDSGLMHVATAVGVPTVGVFSASNPRNDPVRTGPFGPAHRIVSGDPLADVQVGQVYAQAVALLGTKAKQHDS